MAVGAPTIFPLPNTLLVVGTTRGLQCWKDGELLDELDERDGPLSDPDELSTKIPQEEWELGLDGQTKTALGAGLRRLPGRPGNRGALARSSIRRMGRSLAYERLTRKLEMMAGGCAVPESPQLVKPRQPADEDEGGRLEKAAAGIHHPRMAGHRGRRGQVAAASAAARQVTATFASDQQRFCRRNRGTAGGKEADANRQAGEAGYSARRTRRHLAFLTAA